MAKSGFDTWRTAARAHVSVLRERNEPGPGVEHLIAVAHPDGGLGRVAAEERVRVGHGERGPAVFAGVGPAADFAAEVMGEELHAVADAEDGDAEVEQGRVELRGVRLVHARRPAGEDDALRVELPDAIGREIAADDLTEDVQLPHPPGDELGELRAEVEDEDEFGLRNFPHRPTTFEDE